MNKKLLRLSVLSLLIAFFAGCSTTNKESVKLDSTTTKSVEESSKVVESVTVKEATKVTLAVVTPKEVVKQETVVKAAEYVDPRDALEKRRTEIAKKRLATAISYDEQRQ